MAQVNLNSPKQLLPWVRIQDYPGSLLNKSMQAAPLHWGLRAHTQDAPWPLASVPRNISGHIRFTNWASFVVSNLWGSLEQVEVTMPSASVCVFLKTCILGSYRRKVEYPSVLLHTIFLTALMVPLEAPKSGWRETAGMVSPGGVGCMWVSVFSEGSSLWHIGYGYDDVLVFACYSNITACGLLLLLLCSSIYKVPSANFRQNSEAGLLSSAKA